MLRLLPALIGAFLILALTLAAPLRAQTPDQWFEIEALNPGLGPAPDEIDLRTPYDAMASFLDAVEAQDFDAAAHVLNLSDLEPETQRRAGPELARQLAVVLDRKVILPWDELLSRPDNLDADASTRRADAGSPRRSILVGQADNGKRVAAIRLNRVKPPNGDPVWVFAASTVRQIVPLYDRHGPTQFERMLPVEWRTESAFGLARWELVAVPLMLVLVLLAGRLLYALFDALADRARGQISSLVLEALRWPSVLAAATTILAVASGTVMTFSGIVSSVVQPLVVLGYLAALLLFGLKVTDAVMARFVSFDMGELAMHDHQNSRSLATTMTALRRALVVVSVLIGIAVVVSTTNLFGTFGLSLLASAGAVTLILGFAARRVLGNIMASLQIALNRSARIGDQIIYEGHWCTVERIHFTYVQLKVWDDTRLVVPVEHFVSDSFENLTLMGSEQTRTVRLTMSHRVDLDAMREKFREIVAEDEGVTDAEQALMRITDHDAFGPVVRFQFPVPNPDEGWATECRLREKLLRAAQEIDGQNDRPALPEGNLDREG